MISTVGWKMKKNWLKIVTEDTRGIENRKNRGGLALDKYCRSKKKMKTKLMVI